MPIDKNVNIVNLYNFITKLRETEGNVTVAAGVVTFPDGETVNLGSPVYGVDFEQPEEEAEETEE